jgi:hypothetical protein
MTQPLADEIDEILGFLGWESLRREAGQLMVIWIDGCGEGWHRFDEPVYTLRADTDRLDQLIADIAAGRRSVTVVNKDTLKEVEVKADFWTIYRWEIHRGPPATLREHGAEWAAYQPRVTEVAPAVVLTPGKPPGKRLPTPDQTIVDSEVRRFAVQQGRRLDQSDETVREVQARIPGARQKGVRTAIQNLPPEYQMGKGRPRKNLVK